MKALEHVLIVAGVLTSALLLSQAVLAESKTNSTVAAGGTACEVDSDCGGLQYCDKSFVACVEPLECPDPQDTDCLEMAEKINEKYGDCEPGPLNKCQNFPSNSCLSVSDCDGPAYECHYLESCACWGSSGDGGSATEECVCSTNDYGTCLLKLETCETASDCTGDFAGYECGDTMAQLHCFVTPEGYVGYNQEKDDDTALCLSGHKLSYSVCAPEFALKPQSGGTGVPSSTDGFESRQAVLPLDLEPTGHRIEPVNFGTILNDPLQSVTPRSLNPSNVPNGAAGGCHIGSGAGAGAGGAVLPMLVLLAGWITRRRLATTH